MRRLFILGLILFTFSSTYSANRFWIASTASNWNNTANWSATSNGAGGASVPGASDVAIFDGAGSKNGNCTLDITVTVGGITMAGYTGTINVSGRVLTTTGANTFTTGRISNTGAAVSFTINSTLTTTFNGTQFTLPVTGNSARLFFSGSQFTSTVNLTKDGASGDSGAGGNTFGGATTITNTGAGALQFAQTNPDIFNGTLTINNGSTAGIQFARIAAASQFNGNIVVNYPSLGTVSFGINGGTSTLASGRTITVGTSGASGHGNLTLANFTQAGSTAQNLSLSGNTTAVVTFGPSCTFNAALTVVSPSIMLNSSTFQGVTQFTKTGTNTDNLRGGNVFNGVFTVNNQGADFCFGTNGADAGDRWNANATFNNSGGNRIRVAESSAGNVFAANATFNCLATAAPDVADRIQISRLTGGETTFNGVTTFNNNGVLSDLYISYDAGTSTTFNGNVFINVATSSISDNYIGGDGVVNFNANVQVTNTTTNNIDMSPLTGNVNLANGTLSIGGAGFTGGRLQLKNFKQTGTAATNLTLTGTAILDIGPNSAFNGNFSGTAPRVVLDGATYQGTTYIEKTGGSTDTSIGNNVFNGTTTFVTSGTGTLRTGATGVDTFNGPLTLTTTNTGSIQLSYGIAGNVYNNNITVNSTTGTGGISFGANGGTSTLASGRTLSIGGSGFSSGDLSLMQFTQQGSAAVNLTLTSSARILLGPSSQFGGNVNITAPSILLNGTTFSGTSRFEKTGSAADTGNGGNTFTGASEVIQSGSGNFILGNSSPDIFSSSVILSAPGTGTLFVAHNAPGTQFNGDIQVNSTNSGSGIYFSNGGSGSSTLASGRTITAGVAGFLVGQLRLQRFTQLGNTPQNLSLAGTAQLRLGPSAEFNGNVNFSAPRLYLLGVTCNGVARLEKNGVSDDTSTGGNVFNGATELIHSGSDNLIMANNSPDIFNGNLILSTIGPGFIYMAHNVPGTQINGNLQVNSISGGNGIYFSQNSTGSATLASGRTISVGTLGFTTGQLRLPRFTQVGNTAQSLTLTNTAQLRLGPATQFDGNINFVAPTMIISGLTCNGTAYLEKNGSTDDTGAGGDVFNGTTTLVNSGSGTFEFANTSPDIFNANLTVNNTGSYRMQIGISSAGNQFNGNVTVNHGGTSSGAVNLIFARNSGSSAIFNGTLTLNNANGNTASGIIIGNDGDATINGNITAGSTSGRGVLFGAGSGTVTLSNGFSINAPVGTYTTGTLTLKNFTQVGPTPQTLTLTGNADITVGPSSTFNGNVNFVTPQIFLNGSTFNGTTYIEKNGATANNSVGSNIFNGVTTLVNSGSGNFITAVTSQDIFNNDVTLLNTGSAYIGMADGSAGNVFGGNILVNSTSGNGVYFGNNAGASASLAAGKTITVGSSGFNSGELRLRRFTQIGSTAQTLTLTGTTAVLRIGPASSFDGNLTTTSPRVLLDGSIFNGVTRVEKNGQTDDVGVGGNTFNNLTTLVASGTGYLMSGNTSPDIFNGDLTLTNTNIASIRLANNSSGNQFNGNIIVNSTAGTGILIGNTGGNSTFAAGKTITVGLSGFTTGELRIRRFTQSGSTAQNVTLTGAAMVRIGPAATFNGDVTFIAPQVNLDGGTFNGVSYFEKNGTGDNDNAGGNVFNNTTTIVNSSIGRFRLADGSGDQFNGAVTFTRTGSGLLQPAYNSSNQFSGDITVNSPTAVIFGTGNGIAEITGTAAQSLNRSGAGTITVNRLTMNKASQQLTINTDLSATTTVFNAGVIKMSGTNIINITSTGTATGMSNSSYVDGMVRKTGAAAFTFPVGANGFYRPIGISAPSGTTHHFTAQYFNAPQAFGGKTTWDPTFWTVSACEYWILDRTNGTSSVNVTLSWNELACGGPTPPYVTAPSTLRVTRWTGTNWVNAGNTATSGSSASGTVTSATVSSFSPFTLATLTGDNPLPVELKKFWAVDNVATETLNWITASELNNESFTLQRSQNGIDFEDLITFAGAGTTNIETSYSFVDEAPKAGLSYYRLKQRDFDGTIAYPGIISVHRKGEGPVFTISPNPAGNEIVKFNQKASVVIYNSLDQVMAEAQEIDHIDITALPAGVYIIKTKNGQVARLVKK